MSKRIFWAIFACNLVITSCSNDLQYVQKHPENIPDAWNSKDSHYINKTGKLACMAWWHQYHDPDLNRLIKLGMQNNNNINAAMANIEAALGELKRVELNWLPTMSGNLGYSSFPYLGYPGVLATIVPTYTINIFRQIKEQKQAKAELQVTRAMRDGVTLTVIAHIAGSYFSYIAQRERLYLLQNVERDLAEAVSIYQLTYRNGLTSDIDLAEANVELDLIKGEETVIKNNMVIHQNSLRYLLNENPSSFRFKHRFGQIDSHQLLIGSLPLNIIENRPDIAEAMNELNITDAGVGIATSNFLPTIQLSAARGDIATIANGTTLGPPIYFNQALVQQPLITLTSLGELARSKGIRKAAYYRYINTLRSAIRDINNDLSAHDYTTQRLDKTVEAKQNTQKVYQLNHDLYQQGIISYVQLLEEKIKLDKIKILVNTHKLEQTLTVVNLYQDLAVGYGYKE